MQYNPGDGSGVVDEIDDICGSDSVSYTIQAKTRRVNMAIDRFYDIALKYSKTFIFDDKNKYEADGVTLRKLPIGRTQINAGQQDYPFASELLYVNRVFVKGPDGVNRQIFEEDPRRPETLLQNAPTGIPTTYKLIGNSILLGPTPNYTQALSLEVEFGRNGSKFTINDTNKVLGVPSLYYEYICHRASLPYLIQNRLPQKNDTMALIQVAEESIKDFMAMRNLGKRSGMAPAVEDNM